MEDVDDTELVSPGRSRPTWAEADTGVAPAVRNWLRTSPFSSWEDEKGDESREARSGVTGEIKVLVVSCRFDTF